MVNGKQRASRKRKTPESYPKQLDAAAYEEKCYQHLVAALNKYPRPQSNPISFREMPAQRRAVSQVVNKLLSSSVAVLHAEMGTGKTWMAGMAMSVFAGCAQQNDNTRGKTACFFVNLSRLDPGQMEGTGAYKRNGFLFSDANAKAEFKERLDHTGLAVAMLTRRAFTSGMIGKGNFLGLEEEDFKNENTVRNELETGNLPGLTVMAEEQNIKNVVIIIDEYHMATYQQNGTTVKALVGQKLLSQASWLPHKYNFYVLGLSGTPEDRHNCKINQWHANLKMFYTLKPAESKDGPQLQLRGNLTDAQKQSQLAALIAVRSTVESTFSETENCDIQADFFCFRNSEYNKTANDGRVRSQWLDNPQEPGILSTFARMCIMNSCLPANLTEDPQKQTFGTYASSDGKTTFQFRCEVPTSLDTGLKYATPGICKVVAQDLLSDSDCASFLKGEIAHRTPLNDLNPLLPKKRNMRQVVAVSAPALHTSYRVLQSYPCVLLAVECSSRYKMRSSKAAAQSLNMRKHANSHVFDMTDMDEEAQTKLMKTVVKEKREENKQMIIILVRAQAAVGANDLFAIADATVFCGKNKELQKQIRHRPARDTVPTVGRIVPTGPDWFIHYTVTSPFTVALECDTHNNLGSTKYMPEEEGETMKMLDFVESFDKAAANRMRRYLFKLGNKGTAAKPLCSLFPRLLSDCVHPSLMCEAKYLFEERQKKSTVWKKAVLLYFEMLDTLVDLHYKAP